jgi:hypothetical protein
MKVKEQGEVVLLLEGVDEEEAMGLAMKSSQEQPPPPLPQAPPCYTSKVMHHGLSKEEGHEVGHRGLDRSLLLRRAASFLLRTASNAVLIAFFGASPTRSARLLLLPHQPHRKCLNILRTSRGLGHVRHFSTSVERTSSQSWQA